MELNSYHRITKRHGVMQCHRIIQLHEVLVSRDIQHHEVILSRDFTLFRNNSVTKLRSVRKNHCHDTKQNHEVVQCRGILQRSKQRYGWEWYTLYLGILENLHQRSWVES